jgi:citrate lyase subunit beta/citryl-CoA lyase
MRSKLFVPASRPELFGKALASAADAISFDLEDAVAPESKSSARIELRRLLDLDEAGGGVEDLQGMLSDKTIIVRVNAINTGHFAQDMDAVVRSTVDIINLPMVESAGEVQEVAERLEALERERGLTQPLAILANIESPRGLRLAAEIATAHERVMGLQIGYGDLFSPLGIASGELSATQTVRVIVRIAAGEAGIDAFDGAFVNMSDPDGYRADSLAARRLGYAGRSCIHPSQIEAANDVFRPSEEELGHALRVVEAAKQHLERGTGAFTVDGRLVDGPFIVRAERVVALASRLGMIA